MFSICRDLQDEHFSWSNQEYLSNVWQVFQKNLRTFLRWKLVVGANTTKVVAATSWDTPRSWATLEQVRGRQGVCTRWFHHLLGPRRTRNLRRKNEEPNFRNQPLQAWKIATSRCNISSNVNDSRRTHLATPHPIRQVAKGSEQQNNFSNLEKKNHWLSVIEAFRKIWTA